VLPLGASGGAAACSAGSSMVTSSRMNGGRPGSVVSPIFTVNGSTRPGAGVFAFAVTGAIGGGVGAMPVARPQSSSPAVRCAAPSFTSKGFDGGGCGGAAGGGGADGVGGFGCDSSSCRARAFDGSSFSACSNSRRAPS
jgi:hypothetical protein